MELSRVLVLISTYNGEKYIKEQLESIENQEGVRVSILIRDDGSTDKTIDIINDFIVQHPNINLISDCNIGYAKSFMTLVRIASNEDFDYFAFCDQDDVWCSNKLSTAISNICNYNDRPALYLSQAIIVDENLNPMKSSFHKRIVALGPALEHNFAIGCTMVFNKKLCDLCNTDFEKMNLTCGHDSWVFLVALATGSFVFFDENGYVKYRQHGKNASGKITSLKQALRAIKKILFKWKNARSDTARKLLSLYDPLIDDSNRRLLIMASDYKNDRKKKRGLSRCKEMKSNYLFVDLLFKISVFFNLF